MTSSADTINRWAGMPRKPLAGYLRLTVDRNGNKIGYDVQKQRIEAMAAVTGDTIGQWYKDRDLTAADLAVERPEYEQMLRDIKAGKWGGIVVWRLDRLVRLTREFERVWGVVEDARGYIASAEPMISTRDDIGLMFMRLLVMFAEMEISAMKARARGHQQAKREAGKYKGGGSRPFGFEGSVKDATGRVLNPGRVGIAHVPEEVELIHEAARRVISGESDADVLRDWADRGVRGPNGALFTATALRQVLTRPRVAGLREYTTLDDMTGEERVVYVKAEWEPILDSQTWERVRATRNVQAKRGRPNSYLLSGGLVVCGRCGRKLNGTKLYGNHGKQVGIPGYRCDSTPSAKAQGSCGALTVYAEPVDKLVIAYALTRAEDTREVLEAMSEVAADESRPAIEAALTELDWVNTELEALAGERGRSEITPGEHRAAREPLAARRDRALLSIEAARQAQTAVLPVGDEWNDLQAWYEALPFALQRSFIRLVVRSVRVAPGTRGGGGGGGAVFDRSRVEIIPALAE